MKRLFAIAALALAACAQLPHADENDARRAQSLYPGLDLATLEQGRQTYVERCSSCHALHRPSEHSPEEWARRIHEMGQDAKLQPGEEQLIAEYLMTMSLRSQGAGGR